MAKISSFFILMSFFAACSMSPKVQEEDNSLASTEESLLDDALVDFQEVNLDELNDEGSENILAEVKSEEKEEVVEESVQSVPEVVEKEIDQYGEYITEKSESLMLVAFKIYGDYLRWRELAELNRDRLGENYFVKKGTSLKYTIPSEEFSWNPGGNPYLIKKGDYLVKISKKLYGTTRKWKDIWFHNKRLIKDPNLIFVGFTIYYIEDEQAKYATNQ